MPKSRGAARRNGSCSWSQTWRTLDFFKYFNFFPDSGNRIASLFGVSMDVDHLDVILPIGISFDTFHTLSMSLKVIESH
jgi:D-alanyl-lipoteichoic acid acyltransferase DltB (MBOAT superfamily)